ncbi:MAG: hypothetical protein US49_C0014G0017 [candidate division TM6 bacterium GW2011_GWF2_37_49]|nr:MAG: hypothetical protein US49_C0014G0017 [candidate division TM6 bacterium GW2011_GWF2_37_49]
MDRAKINVCAKFLQSNSMALFAIPKKIIRQTAPNRCQQAASKKLSKLMQVRYAAVFKLAWLMYKPEGYGFDASNKCGEF